MRCSCQVCGTYMVHSESSYFGCVCPECGQRCRQCLGTDSVVSKEDLQAAMKMFTARYTMDELINAEVSASDGPESERNDNIDQYRD